MFRMWAKEWKDNHLLKDTVIEDAGGDTRTHRIFNALDAACHELDLARPVWLDANVEEFKRDNKTRFRQDSFIETVPFDYLEIQIIEE